MDDHEFLIKHRELVANLRSELYEQVWTDPIRTVAPRYGCSDVMLGKVCRRLSVPLPPRGYWAKKAAGRKPRRPALPKLKQREIDMLSAWIPPSSRSGVPPPRLPVEVEQVTKVAVQAEIVVSEGLEDPHALVARAKRLLETKKPQDAALFCRTRCCLDICVSPTELERALRILDALLKGMEKAGLRVEVTPIPKTRDEHPPRPPSGVPSNVTRVLCDNEWIQFALAEKVTRSRDPRPEPPPDKPWMWIPQTYSHTPTGRLMLSITNVARAGLRLTWGDGKRQRLEDLLADFIAYLGRAAAALKFDREEAERNRLAAIEAEERRRAEQERRWEEERRAKELLGKLEPWRLAREIRAHVSEACSITFPSELAEEEAAFRAQLKWAEDYADRIDPLKR